MSNANEFHSGDNIRVVDRPFEPGDKRYANLSGKVKGISHTNSVGDVYQVTLDNYPDSLVLLYGRDMLMESSQTLEERAAKLEAELAKIKAEIRNADTNASKMPVGTVVLVGASGPDVESITKQAENKWLGVYLKTTQGDVRNEVLDDHTVTRALRSDTAPRIHRP